MSGIFLWSFSPVNLTTLVANVNPALTSHVNNIKIYFLKTLGSMNVGRMRRRYSVRSLQKSNVRSVLRILDCYIYIFSNGTHRGHFYACAARTWTQNNLRGAPYELLPEYFVNSLLVLMTRPRRACEFAQSQGLASHEHKVWSGWRLRTNKILDIYVVLYSWILISYEFDGFLSVNNSINVVITALPLVSTSSIIKFLKKWNILTNCWADRGKTQLHTEGLESSWLSRSWTHRRTYQEPIWLYHDSRSWWIKYLHWYLHEISQFMRLR